MMRMNKMIFTVCGMLLLSSCGNINSENADEGQNILSFVEKGRDSNEERRTVTIKTSPDKHTWYIKDYVGKNVASFGYTSLSGNRMDEYGDGYLKVILVNEKGTYIDTSNEDELKKYVVVEQNIRPNTEMKYIFPKDEEGNEVDTFPESQSYEEIVLAVTEVKSSGNRERKLTEISPSPDKYTSYIRDYTGRNLLDCGYMSMAGDFRDAYSDGTVKFVIVTDDGSFVDVSDEEALEKYIVIDQNIEPNTEFKLEYSQDETGVEYSNLVSSQNINEIELYVSSIDN